MLAVSFLFIFLLLRSKGVFSKSTNERYRECLMMERASDSSSARMAAHQRIVRVPVHEPAYLHCVIPQHSNNVVAWTRVSDEALLTAGEQSFTTDPRFQISLKPSESDWVLIIRRVEKSDSGCYLCEVNTEPKSAIYPIYLNVIDEWQPNAQSSAAKRTTKLMANMIGNEVLLNCMITLATDSANLDDNVLWSRDGAPIDFSKTNKYLSKMKRDSRTIVHTLRILGASSDDDGKYSCRTVDSPESSHMLHVNSDGSRVLQFNSLFLMNTLFLLCSYYVIF